MKTTEERLDSGEKKPEECQWVWRVSFIYQKEDRPLPSLENAEIKFERGRKYHQVFVIGATFWDVADYIKEKFGKENSQVEQIRKEFLVNDIINPEIPKGENTGKLI